VNGKSIVANGKVATIDVDNLRQELFLSSQWHTQEQAQNIPEIEAHYRSVMDLPQVLGYS